MGYISSGLFSKLDYGAPLRQFLTSRSTILEIVEFGEEQVFEGAVTYPIILSLKNELPKKTATLGLRSVTDLTDDTLPEPNPVPKADDIWAFTTESLQHILRGWKKSRPLGGVLGNTIRRGITTGLNEAFILDRATGNELVEENPNSAEIIKPCVRGEDLRPWHQEDNGLYLIFSRKGIDIEAYPAIRRHLEQFREKLEPKPRGWTGRDWPGRKAGAYKWHELQDPTDYYSVFEQPRIHSTKVSLVPTFSFSEEANYALNTSYVLPVEDKIMGNYLLGVLNSRVCEFYCRKVFAPKANGYFEIQPTELSRLPVPDASDKERGKVGKLAEEVTAEARARYMLHERTRRRIFSDLGPNGSGKKLNQKLTTWWNLDFSAFRAEIKKAFKEDIPLAERDEWEDWLGGRRVEHERLTAEIVRLEMDLNGHVYELFELGPEEIQIIEESTKYRYGEV
jgi:hypothetical protein